MPTQGWSPSVTTTRSASGSARSPQRSEAACPSSQSSHTTGSARPKSTASLICSRPGAEHDDHALQRVGGHRRVDGVLQQRPAVELGELLGLLAEATARAGGEHEPRDHQMSSRIVARSSSDAMELPASRWSVYGSAACIPRVSGAYSGCAASGLSHTTR